MNFPPDNRAAKRKKADGLRRTSTLFFVLAGVWFVSAMLPVVLDWIKDRPVEGPNVVFLTLTPVWMALGAAQRAKAKTLYAELGGDAPR